MQRGKVFLTNVVLQGILIMVEEKKKAAVKKTVASKVAAEGAVEKKAPAVKKAPAAKKVAAPVWPFPAAETVAEVKKAPAKKPAAKKAAEPAKAKAAPKAKAAAKQEVAQPSAQERYRMVETAAYYIAERSGFQGCAADHWAQAEVEIAAKLAS